MDVSRVRRSAFTTHFVLAVSAYKFSRKYVVENLFFAARREFVFFVDSVYFLPQVVGDNARKDIRIDFALMFHYARIAFIV